MSDSELSRRQYESYRDDAQALANLWRKPYYVISREYDTGGGDVAFECFVSSETDAECPYSTTLAVAHPQFVNDTDAGQQ